MHWWIFNYSCAGGSLTIHVLVDL